MQLSGAIWARFRQILAVALLALAQTALAHDAAPFNQIPRILDNPCEVLLDARSLAKYMRTDRLSPHLRVDLRADGHINLFLYRPKQILLPNGDALQAGATRLADTILDIGNIVKPHLASLPETSVSLRQIGRMESSAMPFIYQLNLPELLLAEVTEHDKIVISHEVGHLIFDRNLRDYTQSRGLLKWAPELSLHPEIPKWVEERNQLATSILPTYPDRVFNLNPFAQLSREDAARKLQELNHKIEDLKINESSDRRYLEAHHRSFPYHEVYADAHAMIHTGTPNAMSAVLKEGSPDFYIRNFTFDKFDILLQHIKPEQIVADPHIALMRVRRQLYAHYYEKTGMKVKTDKDYDAFFLKATFEAMADLMYNLPPFLATNPNPKAVFTLVEIWVNHKIQQLEKEQYDRLHDFLLEGYYVRGSKTEEAMARMGDESLRQVLSTVQTLKARHHPARARAQVQVQVEAESSNSGHTRTHKGSR